MTVPASTTPLPDVRSSRVPAPAHRVETRSQEAPERIVRPVMLQRWDHLSFLHWPCDPGDVQRRLPPGLEVDTFDGAAWIGLIPFRLTVTVPGVPRLPWASSCPEINLRTYVRGPDGRPGIWFFSLEASRLGAVLMARAWYRLPYMWSWMRLERRGALTTYRSGRRWPRGAYPSEVLTMEVGQPIDAQDVTPLEVFLTARWLLYSPLGPGLARTRIWHPPWLLHRARPVDVHDELVATAGLPVSGLPPHCLYSPGVASRFASREPLCS
jgi:uncharacterized protein YqjF (DUF2071 family)